MVVGGFPHPRNANDARVLEARGPGRDSYTTSDVRKEPIDVGSRAASDTGRLWAGQPGWR